MMYGSARQFGLRNTRWRLPAMVAMTFAASSFFFLFAQQQAPSSTPPSWPSSAPGQDATTLEPGRTLVRELMGHGGQTFSFPVPAGLLAEVVIESQIDLRVKLLDPQGNRLLENAIRSGEAKSALEFIAAEAGDYQIQIELTDPKAPGKYQIELRNPRLANDADRDLYEASRRYSESWGFYRSGSYQQAQAAAEHSLELREKILGTEAAGVGRSLNRLGMICLARDDYGRANALLQRALAIAHKTAGSDSLEVADVTDNLAQNASARANYAEAERLARQALAIREKVLGSDHYLVAASLVTLGEVLLIKADFTGARPIAERALAIAAKSYSSRDLPYTDAVSLLGRIQARQGNYASAEQLLVQNLQNREAAAGPDSLQAANALQDLGSLYIVRIDNLKSEQMNLRALALKEKILGRDHVQVAFLLHNLGLVYYRRGDYDNAEKFYREALDIKEKLLGPDHPQVAPTVNNLGLMYWRQHQYPKAAECFKRALEIEERAYGPESVEITYPLGNLGIIAKETGDYANAEIYYKRVVAIKEKVLGPNHPDLGITVESLGILYRDQGEYAKAEPYFLRSVAITNDSYGVDHPDNLRHLLNLSQLYAAEGDVAKSLDALQRLDALEEKTLPLNLAVGSERQKLAYFDPFIASMERMISFQLQEDPHADGARKLAATALVYRKGRVLDAMADSLGALWNRSSPEDREVLDHLKKVTSQLAALVLNGPKQLSMAEYQQHIQDLNAKREQLENEAARRSTGFYEGPRGGTLAAIQSAIPAKTVLIELGVYSPFDPKEPVESKKQFGEPRYAAYVISGRDQIQSQDLGPAREIDAAVAAFREALRDPRQDVKPLARALYEKIMKPLQGFTGDATHLLISPDGQLDLIPFEALVDEQGRYLVEQYSVSYLTTGRDLLRMRVARASKSGPLVIADPAFGEPGNTLLARSDLSKAKAISLNRRRSVTTGKDLSDVYFAPLSGTAQEASVIQSLFPEAQVLTGTKASKSALKQVNAPRILHIATHGFFLQNTEEESPTVAGKPATRKTRAIQASSPIENPLLRAGLALSGANLTKSNNEDGILTALEAANLNLWGTKLVTLSACETGVGDVKNGEGVYGLRRAFVLAGAESLVMSLWPVSDYVTREMMTAYYTGLKKGLGRGDALRQAELGMLKRKGREHPFYWASFIQSGEWANLEGQR
ncbi:MAG TPA: CHAT domain-containing tetratricopeptide repeat protein [Terriglobales bacterium]